MKYLMKVMIPNETGNKRLRDPEFGRKIQKILADVKAEAAYFTTVDGCRGGYVVVNINNASEIPGIGEPFFMWLEAEIDFIPVMTPEDLGKADSAIQKAVKEWG